MNHRTSAILCDEFVEIRLSIGLPAAGRSVLGKQAANMLCDDLPNIASASLLSRNISDMSSFVDTIDNADYLRQQLDEHNLISFIPNGAILPRASGTNYYLSRSEL